MQRSAQALGAARLVRFGVANATSTGVRLPLGAPEIDTYLMTRS